MKVKIKILHPDAIIPQYAKFGDAGLDLVATTYEFTSGRHIYGTGLAIEIPEGYVGFIFPRSSICKKDLRLTNSVGVIDSGYRGEIKFYFESDSMIGRGDEFPQPHILYSEYSKPFRFHIRYNIGDRIGQLIILPYPQIEFEEVQELSSSERGEEGFGSSGL